MFVRSRRGRRKRCKGMSRPFRFRFIGLALRRAAYLGRGLHVRIDRNVAEIPRDAARLPDSRVSVKWPPCKYRAQGRVPEHAFGYDLRTVRLHDDAMLGRVARGIAPTAFATGTQIVMDGSVSRHVLAHEVAHVIQAALQPAIHCYESPEHEDLGDKSLDQLQDFLQTEEGKKWTKDHGIDPAKLVKQIEADRLKKAGGKITAGTRAVGAKGKEDVKLTPGEITALSGDFYKGPDEIASAPRSRSRRKAAKMSWTSWRKLSNRSARESFPMRTKPTNKAYEQITKGRYLDLAQKQQRPLCTAQSSRVAPFASAGPRGGGGRKGRPRSATCAAGRRQRRPFPDRCLCLRAPVRQGQFGRRNQTSSLGSPTAHREPRSTAFAGIVTFSGNADQLVLKDIHDRINIEGFDVTNAAGIKWRIFGDAQLAKAPDTSRIAALALFKSRQQIYAAQKGQKPDRRRSTG
jgi:hypothetical protein